MHIQNLYSRLLIYLFAALWLLVNMYDIFKKNKIISIVYWQRVQIQLEKVEGRKWNHPT